MKPVIYFYQNWTRTHPKRGTTGQYLMNIDEKILKKIMLN
jgi:hypothetical protein